MGDKKLFVKILGILKICLYLCTEIKFMIDSQEQLYFNTLNHNQLFKKTNIIIINTYLELKR